jgi:hypothetical protein
MILLVNYYKDKHSGRQEEIDVALRNNIEHPLIDHILVFKEKDIELKANKKIIPVEWKGRPTYSDYFRIGSNYNGIKILANSDIYFNGSLEYCKKIKNNSVFALCRWDLTDDDIIFYNHRDSQDVWIWSGRIKLRADFVLGIPGCDNSIAYLLATAGYKVKSPSKKIKAIHIHKTGVRNYIRKKERVPGPYMYLRYY